jgi:mono/diheme cytochrome c family protein
MAVVTVAAWLGACGLLPGLESVPPSAPAGDTAASVEALTPVPAPAPAPLAAPRPVAAAPANPAPLVPPDPAPTVKVPPPPPPAVDVTTVAATSPPKPALSARQMFGQECAACHMPYPAKLLPARSWQAIMAGLPKHFGEDASLDPETTKQIAAYLVANAADAKGGNSWSLRGLSPNTTPLRITDMPFWRAIHGRFSAASFARRGVKSKGDCVGCHGPGAAQGRFGD